MLVNTTSELINLAEAHQEASRYSDGRMRRGMGLATGIDMDG